MELVIRACTVLLLSCGLCSIPTTDYDGTAKGEASQCWLESMLGTVRKSLEIEIELVNWDKLILHMLKTLRLYKNMEYIYLEGGIMVDSNMVYCVPMLLGFKIERIGVAKK